MDEKLKIGLIGTGSGLIVAGQELIDFSRPIEQSIIGIILVVCGTAIIATGGYLIIKQLSDAIVEKLRSKNV